MKVSRSLMVLLLFVVLIATGCSQQAAETASEDAGDSGGSGESAKPQAAASRPASRPKPKPVVLPAGTEFEVMLTSALSSKESKDGDPFEGTVHKDVVVNGKVVIPKDADVTGAVTKAVKSGRFKGRAELWVTLTSVTIKGRKYDVATDIVGQKEGSKVKRNILFIGGGTGAGAAVGAAAPGGGSSTATGAAIGAAAGAAGALLTGKRNIKFPVETVLLFALEDAVTIRQ